MIYYISKSVKCRRMKSFQKSVSYTDRLTLTDRPTDKVIQKGVPLLKTANKSISVMCGCIQFAQNTHYIDLKYHR